MPRDYQPDYEKVPAHRSCSSWSLKQLQLTLGFQLLAFCIYLFWSNTDWRRAAEVFGIIGLFVPTDGEKGGIFLQNLHAACLFWAKNRLAVFSEEHGFSFGEPASESVNALLSDTPFSVRWVKMTKIYFSRTYHPMKWMKQTIFAERYWTQQSTAIYIL